MLTTAESIAAAILEDRPEEAAAAAELALELAAAAEARGIPLPAALAYVHDRPRSTITAPAFLRWCQRYKITPAAELEHNNTKEPST